MNPFNIGILLIIRLLIYASKKLEPRFFALFLRATMMLPKLLYLFLFIECYQVLATKCPHCNVGDLVESNEIYSSQCDQHLRCANIGCPTIFQQCDGQAPLYWLVCDRQGSMHKVAPMVDADCGGHHRTRFCTPCNRHGGPGGMIDSYPEDQERPGNFYSSSDSESGDDGENH
ncbi:hypothetical protein O181_035576 [Austropuccinia psidii MF-1]|uniref:Uncharacterized protein n=1 Tax=Austropuccinia psidii MF-1 TaxID=1389203 RepID=A0A9Q3D8I9_9BASI|nr:hypothetical protein [Austropuccinia psidii MF-1]